MVAGAERKLPGPSILATRSVFYPGTEEVMGWEISEKGFGFLRSSENHFQPKPTDIFVTPDTIKKNFLREGCLVAGPLQPPHRGSSPQLREVDKVNGMPFVDYTKAMRFENLTTIDPIEKFRLETTPDLDPPDDDAYPVDAAVLVEEPETLARVLQELPLERALELFEQGMKLSEKCRKQLEEADLVIISKSEVCIDPLAEICICQSIR